VQHNLAAGEERRRTWLCVQGGAIGGGVAATTFHPNIGFRRSIQANSGALVHSKRARQKKSQILAHRLPAAAGCLSPPVAAQTTACLAERLNVEAGFAAVSVCEASIAKDGRPGMQGS
jgi:hypothetical protein